MTEIETELEHSRKLAGCASDGNCVCCIKASESNSSSFHEIWKQFSSAQAPSGAKYSIAEREFSSLHGSEKSSQNNMAANDPAGKDNPATKNGTDTGSVRGIETAPRESHPFDANSTQDARLLKAAFAERKQWIFGRSDDKLEELIRQKVSTMTSKELESLEITYAGVDGNGKGFKQELTESWLTPKSREALNIYLKGCENRTDADTLALADIALKSEDIVMFEEAFRGASPAARETFMAKDGNSRMLDAFNGLFCRATSLRESTEMTEAREYVRDGKLSTKQLIQESTGIFANSERAIEAAIDNMSGEERNKYQLGKQLLNGVPAEQVDTEVQHEAMKFYRELHDAFEHTATFGDASKRVSRYEERMLNPNSSSQSEASPKDENRDFNRALKEYSEKTGGLGSFLANDTQVRGAINNFALQEETAARKGETLPYSQRPEINRILSNSFEAFKESKGAAADRVSDVILSAGTLAASIGGALPSGGMSLALIGTVGGIGAGMKVGSRKAVQGADYQFDKWQLAQGFTAGTLNVLGPVQLGRYFNVGAEAGLATRTLLAGTAGAGGAGASGAIDGFANWDHKRSTSDNLGQVMSRTMSSAFYGAGSAMLFHVGYEGLNRYAFKNPAGNIPEKQSPSSDSGPTVPVEPAKKTPPTIEPTRGASTRLKPGQSLHTGKKVTKYPEELAKKKVYFGHEDTQKIR